MPEKFNFTQAYEEIEKINDWFQQENIDLDEALKKYERGMELVGKCGGRLKEAENRFEEIREKYKTEDTVEGVGASAEDEIENPNENMDIPY